MKAKRRWHWAAYGKHPSVRDYFRLGRDFPMAGSFAAWIDRGNEELVSQGSFGTDHCSWRFWTKEARRDHVVCGLLKTSADSVGRPYPFLIMGTGPLDNWPAEWDLMPSVLEHAWEQVEYLSNKTAPGLKAMTADLQNIKSPSPDWPLLAEKRQHSKEMLSLDLGTLTHRIASLSEADPFLCLDGLPYGHAELINLCHFIFKARLGTVPNAVFLGGTVEHTYFALFRRPLKSSDFIQFWSGGSR